MSDNNTVYQTGITSSKLVIISWFSSLASFSWFNNDVHLGILVNLILIFVGMFLTSIIFGGGCATIAGLINKSLYKNSNANINTFHYMNYVACGLTFGSGYLLINYLK
jgi:ABC-type uncharacterized transport system permease subunit